MSDLSCSYSVSGSYSVSVIVPHHNRPELVREALLSIRRQSLAPLEILLVDDNSTPENRAKLSEYADLARLILPEQWLGNGGARNLGVQEARGEWVAFLDDDDLYLPDKLERQIAYLQAHPDVDALGGAFTRVGPDGSTEQWGSGGTRRLSTAYALRFTASMSQCLIIRRSTFLALGGFSRALLHMEDYEFGIRLLHSGAETHALGEPLFLYHYGGERDQLTGKWSRMIRAELRVIRMHAAIARQVFGRLGPMRLTAACLKKHGGRRGRLLGRATWLAGVLLEAACGRLPEAGSVS